MVLKLGVGCGVINCTNDILCRWTLPHRRRQERAGTCSGYRGLRSAWGSSAGKHKDAGPGSCPAESRSTTAPQAWWPRDRGSLGERTSRSGGLASTALTTTTMGPTSGPSSSSPMTVGSRRSSSRSSGGSWLSGIYIYICTYFVRAFRYNFFCVVTTG